MMAEQQETVGASMALVERLRAIASEEEAWLAIEEAADAIEALAAQPLQETVEAIIERCANYIEGAGGVIPGAAVFASLVSGNNQPCMSGDPRDRLPPHKRRQFDDATHSLAAAIRALKREQLTSTLNEGGK